MTRLVHQIRLGCLLLVLLAPLAPGQFTGLSGEVVDFGRNIDGRITGTLRIHAHLANPLDKLFAVYGSSAGSMSIQTTDPLGFYQHPFGGNSPLPLCVLEPTLPNLRYDSWLTIGDASPMSIGIDWGAFNSGGGLATNNGGIFQIPTTPAVCPVNTRVLIAQFTVGAGETVSGTVNLSGSISNGTPPCGTVPNGPGWDAIGVTFSYTISPIVSTGTLQGTPETLSLSVGGSYQLHLDLDDPDFGNGACFAGDMYVMAGSLSPPPPGLAIGNSAGGDALVMPINLDAYTLFTATCPGPPIFFDMCGVLDGSGAALCTIMLPSGSPPSLTNTIFLHAAIVLRPGVGILHVSGVTALTLLP